MRKKSAVADPSSLTASRLYTDRVFMPVCASNALRREKVRRTNPLSLAASGTIFHQLGFLLCETSGTRKWTASLRLHVRAGRYRASKIVAWSVGIWAPQ